MTYDPRARARHYFDKLPRYAVGVDEPWWWPLLALDSGVVNVSTAPRSLPRLPFSLAIVGQRQPQAVFNKDVIAIGEILKAQGKPAFDAFRGQRQSAHGRIVGIVTVDKPFDDFDQSLWFSGPEGFVVRDPVILAYSVRPSMIPANGRMPDGLTQLDERKRDAVAYALTHTAATR